MKLLCISCRNLDDDKEIAFERLDDNGKSYICHSCFRTLISEESLKNFLSYGGWKRYFPKRICKSVDKEIHTLKDVIVKEFNLPIEVKFGDPYDWAPNPYVLVTIKVPIGIWKQIKLYPEKALRNLQELYRHLNHLKTSEESGDEILIRCLRSEGLLNFTNLNYERKR